MGEKIVKKGGKEHIVETHSILGIEYEVNSRELHDSRSGGGTKETHGSIFDALTSHDTSKAEVEERGFWDSPDVRGRGKIGDREGTFEKRSGDYEYRFHQDESESSPSGSSRNSGYSSGGSYSSSSGSSGSFDDFMGHLAMSLVVMGTVFTIGYGIVHGIQKSIEGVKKVHENYYNYLHPPEKSIKIRTHPTEGMIPLDNNHSIEIWYDNELNHLKFFTYKKYPEIFKTADTDNSQVIEKDERLLLEKRLKNAAAQNRRGNMEGLSRTVLEMYGKPSPKKSIFPGISRWINLNIRQYQIDQLRNKRKAFNSGDIRKSFFDNSRFYFILDSENDFENLRYYPVVREKINSGGQTISLEKIFLKENVLREINDFRIATTDPRMEFFNFITRKVHPEIYDSADLNHDGKIDYTEIKRLRGKNIL